MARIVDGVIVEDEADVLGWLVNAKPPKSSAKPSLSDTKARVKAYLDKKLGKGSGGSPSGGLIADRGGIHGLPKRGLIADRDGIRGKGDGPGARGGGTYKNGAAAEKDLAASSKKWKAKLDIEDLKGVQGYAGSMNSFAVNYGLRHGGKFDNPTAKITAQRLEKALDKASMPKDVTAFRSVTCHSDKERAKILGKFKESVGKVIVDKAFVSTTANPEYVANFGNSSPINVRVSIPKGSKAAYMSKDMVSEQEWEIVVQRGSEFKVASVTDDEVVLEMQ